MSSETLTFSHYSERAGASVNSLFPESTSSLLRIRMLLKIDNIYNTKRKIYKGALTMTEERGLKGIFFFILEKAWISLSEKAVINKYEERKLRVYFNK